MKYRLLLISLALVSCQAGPGQDGMHTIPVKDLGGDEINDLIFTAEADFLLKGEDAPLLESYYVANAGKDSFILHDNYRALVSDFSGNVEGVIDRRGRGPGEYNVIQDIFYDDKSGSVFLFDPTEKDRLICVRDAEADGEGSHGHGSTEVICINIKENG